MREIYFSNQSFNSSGVLKIQKFKTFMAFVVHVVCSFDYLICKNNLLLCNKKIEMKQIIM